MTWIEERCPSCGAPLPAGSFDDVLVCSYCKAELRAAPGAQYRIPPKIDEPPYEPSLPRVSIVGTRWVVLGQLAAGASADVFLARRDVRLTETAVLKVSRDAAADERVAREWATLGALTDTSRQGAAHFIELLPMRVLHGKVDGSTRLASVFRWRAGFQFTFEDVRREYPGGVDARTIVWMWKRLLELVGWIHDGGFSHNAIEPSHVVVNPRDHGVHVVGWSNATRGTGDDVAATARLVRALLAGADVPAPVADVLRRAEGSATSAWVLRDELDRAAGEAFGPPRFHRFTLSGWG